MSADYAQNLTFCTTLWRNKFRTIDDFNNLKPFLRNFHKQFKYANLHISSLLTELEVTINGKVPLSGTLSVPQKTYKGGILLITGSGPVDRNENTKKLKLNIFSQIARSLVGSGFLVLRYDKRGVAKSKGSYMKSGLWDLVDDACEGLKFLRNRPESANLKIFTCGHSEGSLIASIIASKNQVSGIILLAPTCSPIQKILKRQTDLFSLSDLSKANKLLLKVFRYNHNKIKIGLQSTQEKVIGKAVTSKKDYESFLFKKIPAKWLREHVKIDPISIYKEVHCPVLIISGTKDLQVPCEDAKTISSLVQGESTYQIITDLTHILRRDYDVPSINAYSRLATQEIDSEVLEMIKRWLENHC